jgi:hypothetical protein
MKPHTGNSSFLKRLLLRLLLFFNGKPPSGNFKPEKYDPVIESLILYPKIRKEVATEYGTTERTLIRKLKKKGIILPPGQIFPGTCKLIYYALGTPAALKADPEEKQENQFPKH